MLANYPTSAFDPRSFAAVRSNNYVVAPTATLMVAPQSPIDVVDATASAEMTATSMATTAQPSSLQDLDLHASSSRLPYSPTGYSTWKWKTHHNPHNQQQAARVGIGSGSGSPASASNVQSTHSINYIQVGDASKPAILLVHGFGASSYHWRYNVPILAQKYNVYALDLLGFGWSDKPIMDYDASVWRDQVVDFVNEVILLHGKDNRVAIAGNSLGGYTAMYASTDERIKSNVSGCILLNAAGRFRDPEAVNDEVKAESNPIIKYITSTIQRFVIACSFIYTKQPARIEQILRQVYPINDANVDFELVESIRTPALDVSAAEVFYRVITKTGSGKQAYLDDILKELDCPVLLLWGESDPWIRSAAADKIQRLHTEFHKDHESSWIKRVSINAGHCPHDEAPEAVNVAILEFADAIFASQ